MPGRFRFCGGRDHAEAPVESEITLEKRFGTRWTVRDFFGVADHSVSAHYAGGLGVEEVAAQQEEIDRLNAQ